MNTPPARDNSDRPAPIWRRVAAAIYDGLLLIALWLTGTLLVVVVQDLLSLAGGPDWTRFFRAYYFVLGLLFFGWCWTHGGQTPGMRAWRLRLQREGRRQIRWPIAAVRYAAMLSFWALCLLPVLAAVPALRQQFPHLVEAGWIGLACVVCGLALARFDYRRRSPQDLVAGTVTLAAPRRPTPPSAHARKPPEPDGGK